MYKIEFVGSDTVHLEVYLAALDSTEMWMVHVEYDSGGVITVDGLWLGFSKDSNGPVPVMRLDVGGDWPLLIPLDQVRRVAL